MNTLRDRLKLAMAGPPKVTQADLARACKISAPSVNDWTTGKTKTIEGSNLLAASARLGVNALWLATGRGPMRLNSSSETSPEPVGGSEPSSQSATLTEDILHEALMLLAHDEGQGGRYSPRPRSERLYELLARVLRDGGRLNAQHNAEFEAEVRARAEGVANGNDLARRRRVAKRGR